MMNVKFLNPFVEAAYEVLRAEMGQDILRGELHLDTGPYNTEDITVIIALVGAVEGQVFYCMSRKTAISIASQLMGETLEDLDTLGQSGIAELGNVITGRASMKLSQAGFEATISPPSLLMGRGAKISTLDYPRLIVPLEMSAGSMNIHLALRQGKSTSQSVAQMAVPAVPKANAE